MNKKKALVKNTLILAVGKLSTQMAALLLVPLYTFFLSPAEYGIVDLVITYTVLLAPVLTLQMEMAVFRFLVDVRLDEGQKKHIISNTMQIVIATIAISIVVFMVVNLLVVIPYGGLILGIGIMTMLFNLFLQIARGLGRNKDFAAVSIISALASVAAALGFVVYAKLGIAGVLGTMLVSLTLGTVYIFFRLHLYRYITFSNPDNVLKKELVQYSLPLIPNGVSWWVISLFDRTIIAIFLGVTSNGIYAVSNKYATIFTSIFSIFGMSWTEAASIHINDKKKNVFFSDVFNMSLRVFGALGILLVAVLPLLFDFAIGEAYKAAYQYIPILILGAFLNAIVGLYSAIYVARKMTKQVMTTSLIAAAINIIINFALISLIGLYAAALATALAYGAMAIYRHYDVKKYVVIDYDKSLLFVLTVLYIGVIYVYYINAVYLNVISVVFVVIISLLLNKVLVRKIYVKVRQRAARV